MRRFSAEYLEHTRRGMWDDGRDALADLDLPSRERVLDVGCGTGELTRVLAAEADAAGDADATVIGVDADRDLLGVAREESDGRIGYLAGDATRLPVADDAVDLAVCQALLINLPAPTAAVRELARVSGDLVAAVEPDNADVRVASTVDAEERLEREAREAYVAGVDTDVALGDRVREAFGAAGLVDVRTRRYVHEKRTEPPYAEAALRSAARKASGAGLADHREELVAATSEAAYDDLRGRWREMGREVVDAIGAEEYERVEYVPFDVTVGRVASSG
ncbi:MULTISPECIES: class I SAM-dependent methyltransferase [unclassified Halorubrum]|uniref:class I SAM-dependent methyltransferase n=1 Tax=unclassified Halorubrum TaxID=2642239 RepID=UPI0010F87A05|nr:MULTISPECIES: class I SAM-dependent methyltransferase [unclassified Halorubrum]TKX44164.1 class I SAM-dependent methyltransferase [Halorubrum sp. ARQ200]TKX50928.1 class I SAM-dependent methyltransferase [Halorubrum sp. ASP121]